MITFDATHAACIGTPTDVFFPHIAQGIQDGPTYAALHASAIAICKTCPIIDECAEHGIKHEIDGVYGGLTPRDRATIRRKQRNNNQ